MMRMSAYVKWSYVQQTGQMLTIPRGLTTTQSHCHCISTGSARLMIVSLTRQAATWIEKGEAAALLHEKLILQLLRILRVQAIGLGHLPAAQALHAAQSHGCCLWVRQRQRIAHETLQKV